MADFPAYEGASLTCSGFAQPGAVAFMEWAVRDYGKGATNVGIYNCRTVRGSTNRSIHGDGRAVDVGFPGVANPAGTQLLDLLLPHVRTLGIQLIIWNRRIWSAKAPNGAAYQGTVPHTDHLHIELTWQAARTLTRDRVRVVVGGRVPAASVPPAPLPQPEDDVYIRDQKSGAIYAISATHYAHLTGPQWADRQKEGAKATDMPPELVFHFCKSRVRVG